MGKIGVLTDIVKSGLTKAEEVAETILNFLRKGEPEKITEEMLDEADDVYLYKNYDLPMDESSRMKRAEEMGYTGSYHGTGNVFKSVDKGRFGTGIDAYGEGFYSTTNPTRADRYAPKNQSFPEYSEGANIIPTMVSKNNLFDTNEKAGDSVLRIAKIFEDPSSDFSVEYKDYGKNSLPGVFIKGLVGEGKSTNIKSMFLDPELKKVDVLTKLINTFGKKNSSEILKKAGYDGLISPEAFGEKTYLTFDPSNVRSKFARFDPMLSKSKNLLASAAPVAVSLGALSELKEEPQ